METHLFLWRYIYSLRFSWRWYNILFGLSWPTLRQFSMNQSWVQRNQWKEEPDALVKDAGIDILTYHMLEMTWQLDNSTLKEQQKNNLPFDSYWDLLFSVMPLFRSKLMCSLRQADRVKNCMWCKVPFWAGDEDTHGAVTSQVPPADDKSHLPSRDPAPILPSGTHNEYLAQHRTQMAVDWHEK